MDIYLLRCCRIIPAAFFSEAFVILTVFSALPIYVMSRKNPPMGLMSFLAATVVIMLFSPHEGMFFVFTNGPIGFILGSGSCCWKTKVPVVLACTFVVGMLLGLLNFGIGVPVLGSGIKVAGVSGILLLFIGLFIYITIYNKFAWFVYRRLEIFGGFYKTH